MTEAKHLPTPVENLRKLWTLKKHEMQITQSQAAESLGWTQGAFSQYLNAITELNPSAVIKLANFLGVDPTEIDPNIDESLPHVHRKEVRFVMSTAEELDRESVSVDTNIDTFCIRIDTDCSTMPKGSMLTVCKLNKTDYIPRTSTNEPYYVVQKKREAGFSIVSEAELPDKSELRAKYLLLHVNVY